MVSAPNPVNSAAQPPQELVFVYGTLKRGMANHRHLAGSTFVGSARLSGFSLFDLGPFPMAVASTDPAAVLQGEVYGVDAGLLAELDRFEGVPRLYERQGHQLDDGRAVWVYVGQSHQVRHVQRIRCGNWSGPWLTGRPASDRRGPAAGPATQH